MDASRAVRSEDPASRWHLSGSDGPERWHQALLGVEDASASKTETSAFVGSCASKRGFTEHVSKSGWMSGDSAVESQERLRGLGARTGGEPAFSNKPMEEAPPRSHYVGRRLSRGARGTLRGDGRAGPGRPRSSGCRGLGRGRGRQVWRAERPGWLAWGEWGAGQEPPWPEFPVGHGKDLGCDLEDVRSQGGV